jgi:hypothetical protein
MTQKDSVVVVMSQSPGKKPVQFPKDFAAKVASIYGSKAATPGQEVAGAKSDNHAKLADGYSPD